MLAFTLMASYTVVRMSLRKADERNFSVSGHTAWVCGLSTEVTGQVVGVMLKVLRPFGSSPLSYFTNDDGSSFRHVASTFAAQGVEMFFGGTEANPETLTTLRQVLATWKSASGHSERRAVIRDTCIGLRELFKSLPQTPLLSHLQDVGSIQGRAQSVPDDKLQEVEEELSSLLGRLRAIEAADGEKILSRCRFEDFLTEKQ